jgi:hypothetical protein
MGELRPNNLELDAIASLGIGNPAIWGEMEKSAAAEEYS